MKNSIGRDLKVKNSGFSLIETLVVLTIITVTVGLAVGSFVRRGSEFKKTVYQFSNIAKVVQNKAKLFNTTYSW